MVIIIIVNDNGNNIINDCFIKRPVCASAG